jgi:hypothetical protein
MEILLIRTPSGFMPADDEAMDQMKKFKMGSIARLDVVQMRNGLFFRKWWALVKIGFDYFADSCPNETYKGVEVLPDFERFRKDVTIIAGFRRPVWNVKGELRVEAESLAWGSMTEERFEKLYSATIDALLKMVFNGTRAQKWTEEELRAVADQISDFA